MYVKEKILEEMVTLLYVAGRLNGLNTPGSRYSELIINVIISCNSFGSAFAVSNSSTNAWYADEGVVSGFLNPNTIKLIPLPFAKVLLVLLLFGVKEIWIRWR